MRKEFKVGDIVRIKPHVIGDKRWKLGKITKKLDNRSYQIESNGNIIRRNISHLKLSKEKIEEGAYDWMPDTDDNNGQNETLK